MDETLTPEQRATRWGGMDDPDVSEPETYGVSSDLRKMELPRLEVWAGGEAHDIRTFTPKKPYDLSTLTGTEWRGGGTPRASPPIMRPATPIPAVREGSPPSTEARTVDSYPSGTTSSASSASKIAPVPPPQPVSDTSPPQLALLPPLHLKAFHTYHCSSPRPKCSRLCLPSPQNGSTKQDLSIGKCGIARRPMPGLDGAREELAA